jgi:hypothetical protein
MEKAMASKTYQQVIQNRQPPRGNPQRIAKPDASARQSEFAVSQHGMNQESEHNKHNRPPKGAPKH